MIRLVWPGLSDLVWPVPSCFRFRFRAMSCRLLVFGRTDWKSLICHCCPVLGKISRPVSLLQLSIYSLILARFCFFTWFVCQTPLYGESTWCFFRNCVGCHRKRIFLIDLESWPCVGWLSSRSSVWFGFRIMTELSLRSSGSLGWDSLCRTVL